MQKRWNILYANNEVVKKLHTALKINETICKILVQRSIDDFEKAKNYFRPQITHLHNPWLMKDMDKAVERIAKAITQNEIAKGSSH